MTGCPKWRDAVTESALSDNVDPALGAHLAVCPGCADALRDARRAAEQMDAALHRRAAVEPPLYGPDQVMARIAETRQPRTSVWWRWALVAACATALLIAIALWNRRPTSPSSVATLASWHSPTDALLQPPVGEAWNTMPRLGNVFFEVKPLGQTHAQ